MLHTHTHKRTLQVSSFSHVNMTLPKRKEQRQVSKTPEDVHVAKTNEGKKSSKWQPAKTAAPTTFIESGTDPRSHQAGQLCIACARQFWNDSLWRPSRIPSQHVLSRLPAEKHGNPCYQHVFLQTSECTGQANTMTNLSVGQCLSARLHQTRSLQQLPEIN